MFTLIHNLWCYPRCWVFELSRLKKNNILMAFFHFICSAQSQTRPRSDSYYLSIRGQMRRDDEGVEELAWALSGCVAVQTWPAEPASGRDGHRWERIGGLQWWSISIHMHVHNTSDQVYLSLSVCFYPPDLCTDLGFVPQTTLMHHSCVWLSITAVI